ncbi:DUF5067 domain-containing protein [Carnobacterium maltaromaticum]|uniref:DUF5067 domain-containing protein n=1 Tax=Carnobacterium maltaromaticum TaxID=2751 RepID=UPI0039AF89E0
MKKMLGVGLFSICSILLIGCGNTNKENISKNKTEDVSVSSELTKSNDESFENDTLTTKDGTIKLTNSEIVADGNSNLFVITYEYTNLSNQNEKPYYLFLSNFELTQENDNAVKTLSPGSYPSEDRFNELIENSELDVKPNGTVQAIMAYKLDDLETPIKLQVGNSISKTDLGNKTFNLK